MQRAPHPHRDGARGPVPRAHRAARRAARGFVLAAVLLGAPIVHAQDSRAALRFHAAGNGQDRASFPLDDDGPGPDASLPADVGAGSFTVELWVRGEATANTTPPSASGSFPDARWRTGRVLVDRGPVGLSARGFAVALLEGRVAFYTAPGDDAPADAEDTTVGARPVLDGSWHHVAVVRDAATGEKRIVVDGQLDTVSAANTSRADLSWPDDGSPGAPPGSARLVLGAERADASAGFDGYVDELRLWSAPRTAREIAGLARRRLLPDTPGLCAEFRFEEGAGTTLADASARASAAGTLVAGQPGNGTWTRIEDDALDVAPVEGSLPLGFDRELLIPQLDHPTAMEFTPDGRLFLAELGGTVRTYVNGALLPTPLCVLPVATGGERGLLGLAVDPDFDVNGALYVFRTTPAGRNRVSKLTVVGDTASLASEVVVWETPASVGYSHHGGALEFSADEKLLVATGDQLIPNVAQDLSSPHGKLLRLERDGSVPQDNPWLAVPGALPELWAAGLRNPFRMRIDAASGRVWLGDVGGNGPSAYEEMNLVERGANYGWPVAEGPACYQSDCSTFRASRFAWRHDDARFGTLQQGCVVAGPTLRGSALPAEFLGNLVVGDYANGWLWRFVLDAAGNVLEEHPFELGNDTGAVVDLDQGPDGALYVLTFVRGTLARVRYGGTGNLAPIPQPLADRVHGVAPLRVQFQGSGSTDPDQGPAGLTYHWLFGDGTTSDEADPTHVFTAPGSYVVTLLVGDGADVVRASGLEITVGHPPVPSIALPGAGTLYEAGDTIAFSGGAQDADEGTLAPAALTWRVLLVHERHEHPFVGPLTGVASGSFTVPASGHGPEHTHYRIELDARDADGLVATTSVELLPRAADLHLATLPIDVPLFLDGEPVVPPLDYESLAGFVHRIEAPESFLFAGRNYVLDGWSTGDHERVIDATMPRGARTIRAFYRVDEVAEVEAGIYAPDRNAEYRAGGVQAASSPSEPLAVCVGDDAGAIEAAFEFPIPLERDVEVRSARLRVTAAQHATGSVSVLVRAYAVADAPPFSFGSPTPLTSHAPLGTAFVAWSVPDLATGELVESPELAPIVQELVQRVDWIAGDRIGLVLSTRPAPNGARRCFANFDSGAAPTLFVRWRTVAPEPVLPPQRAR
ncbi:MAG: PQQ-dependent sugar dehydrogenase [Planctomycetes bacterium]|nr:PQQ-dependent sugar dehydrogenase [Planctomycetota bacterium]